MSKIKVKLMIICMVLALILGGASAADTNYTHSTKITNTQDHTVSSVKTVQDPYNTRLKKHYYGPNGISNALSDPLFKEGDTILVGKGMYNFLNVTKRAKLIAVEPRVVIKGVNIESLSIFKKTNYLVINGFTINNPAGIGLGVTSSSGIKLIHNFILSGIHATGLSLADSNKNILTLNTVKDGMALEGSSENIITQNIVKDSKSVGILIKNSVNNIVSKNLITGSSDEGIGLDNAMNILIFQNIIMGNDKSGIRMDNSKNSLIGNSKLIMNGGDGIRLTGCSNTLIFNSTISRNQNTGVFLGDSVNNLLTENTIINNLLDGVHISVTSVNTLLVSNTLVGNLENQIIITQGIAPLGEGMVTDSHAIDLAPFQVYFNRIIATEGKYAILNNGNSVVNAVENWWGSNSGPGSKISGNVLADPWIVLSISADPTIIATGGRSVITADFLHDSNGKFLDPSIAHLPDGIPVLFGTDLGTLAGSNTVFKFTYDGFVTAILMAGSDPGVAHVTATTDGFTAGPANVTVVTQPNPIPNLAALENTIPMEKTGIPIGILLSAILMLLVGFVASKR